MLRLKSEFQRLTFIHSVLRPKPVEQLKT